MYWNEREKETIALFPLQILFNHKWFIFTDNMRF